ncbi:hypothetical protein OIU76_000803, partial [Salix suchowensis]
MNILQNQEAIPNQATGKELESPTSERSFQVDQCHYPP